jgi:peptidoglycan-associated lipoprotein
MIAAVALAGALAACSSKPPQQLPPEPGPAVTTTTGNQQLRGPAPGSQADFLASMMGQDTIHFALDKYDLDDVAIAALRTQAGWLARYPGKRATIEGHCDERGTRDYNLALGERRANSAKAYLVSLGVDGSRLTTVSYGKERPIDTASTEEAWARNRRAVTVTID